MQCVARFYPRGLVALAFGSCVLAVVGCGGGSSPAHGPTGTVTGKVTVNGKSVPNGCTVVFVHEKTNVPASGIVGGDGSYSAAKVLAGPNKVSITPPAKATTVDQSNMDAYKAAMMGKKDAGPKGTPAPFPTKYLTPEKSGLSVTVKEGANTYDIELKDGG